MAAAAGALRWPPSGKGSRANRSSTSCWAALSVFPLNKSSECPRRACRHVSPCVSLCVSPCVSPCLSYGGVTSARLRAKQCRWYSAGWDTIQHASASRFLSSCPSFAQCGQSSNQRTANNTQPHAKYTRDTQHDTRHTTHDTRHTTHDTRHTTHDTRHTAPTYRK
jgi:hypothetical protein